MSAHTPGPWRLDLWPNPQLNDDGLIASVAIVEQDGGVIVAIENWEETHEPDVILMAAAPDLLAICEEFHEDLGRALALAYMGGLPDEQFNDVKARVAKVSAALKKARGEG